MHYTCATMIGSLGLCILTNACSSDPATSSPPTGESSAPTGGEVDTVPQNENVAALPFEDGWISEANNALGIQGSFYTFSDATDGGTSSILPADFSASGSEAICANGQAAQVLNADYGKYWGASVGFNLRQEEGDDAAYSWDATAHGVTGFGFVVDQLPVGGELRFNLKAANDDNNYCSRIAQVGYNEFRFDDLKKSCWTSEEGAPDYSALEALHWQFVTNESAGYSFSICVSGLVALLD